MKNFLKSLLSHWKKIAHKIGEFQSRLILSVFYFVIFAPFAVGFKIFADPLGIKNIRGWLPRHDSEESPSTAARRQY